MDVPSRYEETFQARYPNLNSLIPAAFDRLGWRLCETSEGRWRARVSINPCSWGEIVTVLVAGANVYVESACVFPVTVFDWGKNRRNANAFAMALHELGNTAA